MLTTINLGNGEITFFNGTPHQIHLIKNATYVPEIRKHIGGEIIANILPSGVLLNAAMQNTKLINLDNGVTIDKIEFASITPIHEDAKYAHFIIVSAMYGTAYRQLTDETNTNLVTIRDVVVKSIDDPIPIGCLGFAHI